MRSFTVTAVVIKRSNLGEADRLITLFTNTHGKMTVLAKGVRKLTSKRAPAVELFNLISAQIVKGRGDLNILAEVKMIDTFSSWRGQLGRVTVAYQLAEAVDKLTADHQPHPQVFAILVSSLNHIGSLGANWAKQLETWLIEIIQELGFWPKDKPFKGNMVELVESISSRSYNSPKLLKKLMR
ncbi:MAG: DNA repair protein RecO [bacterium]|nr:DNA repair protein RecO [bacterium]